MEDKPMMRRLRSVAAATVMTPVACALLLVACTSVSTPSAPVLTATPGKGANLANPASVYCDKQGYRLEMRTAADGSQSAVCIFPNGSECDEWAYLRGECGPDTATPKVENKAVEAAKIVLARQLNVDAGQITLVSLERVIWPDACLGIARQGEMCAFVQTPGFRVILTIGENRYIYHTDLTGESIRQEIAGARP